MWDYVGVWFSRHGNLLATSQRLVETADAGWTAAELGHLLHVEVKEPLLRLYRAKQIEREKIEDRYVYLAQDPGQRRIQRLRRADRQAAAEIGESVTAGVSPELRAAIVLFFSLRMDSSDGSMPVWRRINLDTEGTGELRIFWESASTP